jgi:hypothetical protein
MKKVIIIILVILILISIIILIFKENFLTNSYSSNISKECVKEGNELTKGDGIIRKCCEGLKPIEICGIQYKPESKEADLNGCVRYQCTVEYCLLCGNNICEELEDPCNCPKDCKR